MVKATFEVLDERFARINGDAWMRRLFTGCRWTEDAGTFDGIRFDDAGRLRAAAHDGLHCFHPDGTLIGKLRVPEVVSNLTFGGPKRNELYITATSSLYTIQVNINGARYPSCG